jgi:hypothetical protein
MANLAKILQTRGELVAASMFQERVLETRQRLFGDKHPHTTEAAMNLVLTLGAIGDWNTLLKIRQKFLIWLLEADPAVLSEGQRQIREIIATAQGSLHGQPSGLTPKRSLPQPRELATGSAVPLRRAWEVDKQLKVPDQPDQARRTIGDRLASIVQRLRGFLRRAAELSHLYFPK